MTILALQHRGPFWGTLYCGIVNTESAVIVSMNYLLSSVLLLYNLPALDCINVCNETGAGQENDEMIAWCIPEEYDVTKPPFLCKNCKIKWTVDMLECLDKSSGDKKMNLHFTFSVREISEVNDADQTLKIPMYLAVEWEVVKQYYNQQL